MKHDAVLAIVLVAAGCGGEAATRTTTSASVAVGLAVCSDERTELQMPTVRLSRDGLRLRIRNETERPLYYVYNGPNDVGGGGVAPPGSFEQLLSAIAGDVTFRCTELAKRHTIRAVDPDNLRPSPELECKRRATALPTATGETRGDLVAFTKRILAANLLPGDEVERAGAPVVEFPVVRVVRDGRVVAAVTFAEPRRGVFEVSSIESCKSFAP